MIPDGAVENKKDGYTYDTTLWTLRVKVSDDGLGKLKVDSATYEAGAVTDKNQAEFTNDYQVEETSLEISSEETDPDRRWCHSGRCSI